MRISPSFMVTVELNGQLDADALELCRGAQGAGDHLRALNRHFLAGDDAGLRAGADDQIGRTENLGLIAGEQDADEVIDAFAIR